MVEITLEDRKRIVKDLLDLNVKLPCSRCENTSFSLISEYSYIDISNSHIPIVVIICNNCKNLNTHAIYIEVIEKETPPNKDYENIT